MALLCKETDSNFSITLQNASIHQATLSSFGVYFRSPDQTNRNSSIILLISEYTPNVTKEYWCILQRWQSKWQKRLSYFVNWYSLSNSELIAPHIRSYKIYPSSFSRLFIFRSVAHHPALSNIASIQRQAIFNHSAAWFPKAGILA